MFILLESLALAQTISHSVGLDSRANKKEVRTFQSGLNALDLCHVLGDVVHKDVPLVDEALSQGQIELFHELLLLQGEHILQVVVVLARLPRQPRPQLCLKLPRVRQDLKVTSHIAQAKLSNTAKQ